MNTIFSCSNRGPPGIGGLYANQQCFETAFAEAIPRGYTQNKFSSYDSGNVAVAPTVLALGVLPQVNDHACSNCLKTLAMADPKIEQCLRFEPYLSNGALIPVGAINTKACQQITYDALNRCAERCASCAGTC
jgi:molybdenum cofactor biosynthesis enzyme MoaA